MIFRSIALLRFLVNDGRGEWLDCSFAKRRIILLPPRREDADPDRRLGIAPRHPFAFQQNVNFKPKQALPKIRGVCIAPKGKDHSCTTKHSSIEPHSSKSFASISQRRPPAPNSTASRCRTSCSLSCKNRKTFACWEVIADSTLPASVISSLGRGMSALLLFAAGVAVGIVGTVIAGVVIINLPPPKRDREPVHFSAIGAGRSMTTGPASTFDFLQRRLQ